MAKITYFFIVGVKLNATRKVQSITAKTACAADKAVLIWRKIDVPRRDKESLAAMRGKSPAYSRICGNYSSVR
jgi:hypothetical protein